MAWGEVREVKQGSMCGWTTTSRLRQWQPYSRGIVDFHLRQQFAIYAEVAETTSLVINDAVSLAGHGDEARPHAKLRTLQGPQQVACDGVDQAWALWGVPKKVT